MRHAHRAATLTLPVVSNRAVALWKASDLAALRHDHPMARVLKDRSGRRHHLYAGSSKVAAVLDGGLELTGVSGNSASIPNVAAAQPTTEIDLRAKVTLPIWDTPPLSVFIAKEGSTVTRSYVFRIGTTGTLNFYISQDGSALSQVVSAPMGLPPGETKHVRVTWRASDGRVQFFLSDTGEPGSWVQHGSNVVIPLASIFASTQPTFIGARNGGVTEPLAGAVHSAEMRPTIDGPVGWSVDFATQPDRTRYFTNTPNLLDKDSSDMEDGVGSWLSVTNAPTVARSTAQAASGAASLIATATATASFEVNVSNNERIPVVPGESLYMRAKGRAGSVVRNARVQIWFYDLAGAFVTNVTGTLTALSTSGWTVLADTLVVPSNAWSARASLLVASAVTGESFYFDEIGVFLSAQEWSAGGTPVKVNHSATTTNDPKFLPYDPVNGKGVYLPGIAANYISTPDQSSLDITGDLSVDVLVALDDWTPAAQGSLFAKMGSAVNRSFRLDVTVTGLLQFVYSLDGSTAIIHNSTAPVPAVDGTALWIRVSRNAATGQLRFYTSLDGITWTQLGANVAGTAGALSNSTAVFEIGSNFTGTSQLSVGRFFATKVYAADLGSGAGTPVFDWRAADTVEPYTTVAERSANAAVVTINRSASGRKASMVDRSLFLLGTDDYLEAFDHADFNFDLTDSFTVVAFIRNYNWATGVAGTITAKKISTVAANTGWALYISSLIDRITFHISDGTILPAGIYDNSGEAGVAGLVGGRRSVALDQVAAIFNSSAVGSGSGDSTTGSLANAEALRVGRLSGSGTTYANAEIMAVAVFREALPNVDLARLAAELNVVAA